MVYVYMSCGSTVFFGLGQIKGEGGFSFHFWRKQPTLINIVCLGPVANCTRKIFE